MKRAFYFLIFLLTLLLLTDMATAQTHNRLRVLDPQSWNSEQEATIEEATLSIRPQGAYFEYGLTLSISTAGSSYTRLQDTLEIVMDFNLPAHSIMHDSWLWVGNDIMQALLLERNNASTIYEGIVNRRRDPSILFKDHGDNYELRVFPLAGHSSRKLKLTWLVPAEWNNKTVSAPLPLDIIRLSHTIPSLQVIVETDNQFVNPKIKELQNVQFNTTISPGKSIVNFSPATITDYDNLTLSYQSPMVNGMFAAVYPEGSDAGYYQVIYDPTTALNMHKVRKIMLLLEQDDVKRPALIDEVRQMMHENYSIGDSFNVMYYSALNHLVQVSNSWVSADSAGIDQLLSGISYQQIADATPFYYFLMSGVNFIKTHGGEGEVLLVSNSDNYNSTSSATSVLNILRPQLDQTIPVHILNFTKFDDNNYYYYYYDIPAQGNDYLFSQLAAITGGNYLRYEYDSYYYNYWDYYYNYNPEPLIPFSTLLNRLFNSTGGLFTDFDIYTDLSGGFCHSRYNVNGNNGLYYRQPFIEVGKYNGTMPLDVTFSAVTDSGIISQASQINSFYGADTLTRKIWAGLNIEELETAPWDNNSRDDIINLSMSNRVLSLYTAFLALEPNDTVHACLDCADGGSDNEGVPSVGIEDKKGAANTMSAMPNPFTEICLLSFTLPDGADKNCTVQITNLLGQSLQTYQIERIPGQSTYTVQWNGKDAEGNTVPAGIYMAVLKHGTGQSVLKIVKQ